MAKKKFDFKKVRQDLDGKVKEFAALYKAHQKELSPLEKLRYKNAILQMGAAHALLKHVNCDPPNMSFEFPPLSLEARERLVTGRRRGRAKAGKKR